MERESALDMVSSITDYQNTRLSALGNDFRYKYEGLEKHNIHTLQLYRNKREREMQRAPYIRQFQRYKNIDISNGLQHWGEQ